MQSFNSVPQPAKFKSKFLLTCSVINILLFPLCVGLEVAHPFILQGAWGSMTFILAGLLGCGTLCASSFWEKPLLWGTLVLSSISIISATICGLLSIIGYGYVYQECSYVWNNTTHQYNYDCSYYTHITTQLVLAVAFGIGWINNVFVVVLCSKNLCRCCRCCKPEVDSSIPIEVVQNPQQLTSMWTISPTGQQFQSYPTVVIYSPYQQQEPMNQQEQQHQPPSAFFNGKTEQPENLDDSPPPYYSTVDTLDLQVKDELQ